MTGAAQQADTNTGYLANNPAVRVVVTLPPNPNLGDIIQVTGVGAGGWAIAQNTGQIVDARNLGVAPGTNLTARTLPPGEYWTSVASSADGTRLVAVSLAAIYTSIDAGLTWTMRSVPEGLPSTLGNDSKTASSADGTKVVVAFINGEVWRTSSGGASWIRSATLPVQDWRSIAASTDGRAILLAARFGEVWTSSDFGASWAGHGGGFSGLPSTANWGAVASSADGTRLAAAASGLGIFTSSNSGVTWFPQNGVSGLSPTEQWHSLASSADGLRLTAAPVSGQIWTSATGGESWQARDTSRFWFSVASSADGARLVALSNGLAQGNTSSSSDQLFTSTDNGATWTGHGPRRYWWSVASSADGTRLIAATDDTIFTSTLDTTRGTTGAITGERGDSVSLQHVGAGQFVVLSAAGSGFALR